MKRELTFKEDGQGMGCNPSTLQCISFEVFTPCFMLREPFDER